MKLYILLSSLFQGVLQNVTWHTCKQIKFCFHTTCLRIHSNGAHIKVYYWLLTSTSPKSDFSGDFPPSLSTFPTYINMKFFIRVWISKRKSIRKTFRPLWGKGPPQAKNLLDLRIILWKIQRFWTKFCKLIWLNLANWTLYLSSFNKITSKSF